MFSTERGCDEFMSKRLIRIFPLYWFLTFATFAAMKAVPSVFPYNPTIVELLKSLFLIPYGHHATATTNAMYPIVSMGHTIQTTMFYYLIFLIAGKLSYRKRGLLSAFFIMVIVISGYIFKPSSPFLKFYMKPDLIYFISGITAYHVCKSEVMNKNKFVKVATALSIILFVTTMCSHNKAILATMILLLLCATVLSRKTQELHCGTYKKLAIMGNWTFSYFLIHLYIVRFAEVFGGTQFCLKALLCDLAAIVLAWGISYVSYKLIEKHFTNALKQKILK